MTIAFRLSSNKKIALLAIAFTCIIVLEGCQSVPPRYSSAAIDEAYAPDFRLQIDRTFSELHEEGKLVSPDVLLNELPERCELDLSGVFASTPLPGSDLYKRVRESTVIVGALRKCTNPQCPIKVHFSGATGVFLNKNGVVATNYHVVEPTERLGYGIATRDGRCFPVTRVLAADKDADVAILQTTATDTTPLAIVPYAPPGTEVAVISHPKLEYYVYSEGVVTGYFPRGLHAENEGSCHQHKITLEMGISADYAKGSSGGPVVDRYARIVGLVRSTIPIYYIEEKDNHDKIQMVRKRCVPAHKILQLTGNREK